jgi:hypothetical protein
MMGEKQRVLKSALVWLSLGYLLYRYQVQYPAELPVLYDLQYHIHRTCTVVYCTGKVQRVGFVYYNR